MNNEDTNLKVFFDDEKVLTALNKFKPSIDARNLFSETPRCIEVIINDMAEHSAHWDIGCQFNIPIMGDKLFEILKETSLDKNASEEIIIILFRFLCEYLFNTASTMMHGIDHLNLRHIQDIILENSSRFSDVSRKDIYYSYTMQIAVIVKNLINHEDITLIKNIENVKKEVLELSETIVEKISEKENMLIAIETKIDRFQEAYNYIGISQAFIHLRGEKTKQYRALATCLFLSSLSIFAIPTINIISTPITTISVENILLLFSGISCELLFLYIFRVILLEFISTRYQIQQIDTRSSLCQFIDNYSEEAKKHNGNDGEMLRKFEAIIFSEIAVGKNNMDGNRGVLSGFTDYISKK